MCEGGRFQAVELDNGERVSARICVAAVPPQALANLLPPEWMREPPFSDVSTFEPSPYVSCYLWFNRKLTSEKFWARVWNPADLNTDLSGRPRHFVLPKRTPQGIAGLIHKHGTR